MKYISVSDAVEKTGKGQTTIYRLCRKHEHTRHVVRDDKKFLIDEDFLQQYYTVAAHEEPDGGPEQVAGNNGAETLKKPDQGQGLMEALVDHLEDEKAYYRQLVERKDEQLERKDRIINNLQERQRELHHLLHHQTQLQDSASRPEVRESESTQAAPHEPEENSLKEKRAWKRKAAQEADFVSRQLQIVYAVLGFVMLLLILAIVYVEELRDLMAP